MDDTTPSGHRISVRGDSNNVAAGSHAYAGNTSPAQQQPTATPPSLALDSARSGTPSDRSVFVIHGQDEGARLAFFSLLRSLDLRPMEWEALVALTGRSTPYLGEVISQAATATRAALVILSPDDVVKLHPDLLNAERDPHEAQLSCQARPNVFIELGMALMAYPHRTVIVEIGHMRRPSDINGLNVIRFDGSTNSIRKISHRLKLAGCAVDETGTDWLDPTRFTVLDTFTRSPSL